MSGHSRGRSTPYRYLGQEHQQYLREYRPMLYNDLVLSGMLYSYLTDIDTQARNKLDLLVTQLAWGKAMNNIRNRAEEIINAELIFA